MYYSGDLYGTSNDSFSIGVGGPAWKANGTTLEARATAGGALTVVRGASPVGNDDLVTKAFAAATYTAPHNMLSASHLDTAVQTAVWGDLITAVDGDGDGLYDEWGRLPGQITATKKYLSQTGSGAVSATPVWAQIAVADISGTNVFALLAGQSGGQTLNGGTAASENLVLRSTANATKGNFLLGGTLSAAGTSAVGCVAVASGVGPTAAYPADAAGWYVVDRGGTAGKAANHFWCEDGTKHVFGDKVGIGTVTPYTSSFAEFLYTGTATSLTYATTITNAANAAAMTATGTGLIWRQYYYDAATPAPALSARIWVSTEGNWTSTASTQNAKIVISPALAGAFPVDRLTISSVGATAILSGSTSAVTSGLANASTTAFYAITGNTGLALSSAEVVDYHRIGVLGVSNTTTAGGYSAYGLVGIAKGGYTESVAGRFVADNYSAINTYAIKAQVRTTNAGTGYGVYLEASTTAGGTNWGFYQAGTENNYFAGKIGVGMTPTYNIDITGNLRCSTGFGCNGKTPQTAYASGGALAAYGTGAFGFDSDAHASALHALVVSIRAALVADGIMS